MNQILTMAVALLAEAEAPAAGTQPAAGGGMFSMLPLMLMLVVLFYFMILRPQKSEQSKRANMLANLKKTDRVVTVGGLYGVVTNVDRDADEITLKVDESTNTKVRVTFSAIARVLDDKSPASTSSNS